MIFRQRLQTALAKSRTTNPHPACDGNSRKLLWRCQLHCRLIRANERTSAATRYVLEVTATFTSRIAAFPVLFTFYCTLRAICILLKVNSIMRHRIKQGGALSHFLHIDCRSKCSCAFERNAYKGLLAITHPGQKAFPGLIAKTASKVSALRTRGSQAQTESFFAANHSIKKLLPFHILSVTAG